MVLTTGITACSRSSHDWALEACSIRRPRKATQITVDIVACMEYTVIVQADLTNFMYNVLISEFMG